MNSTDILLALDKIAADPSKGNKVDLVKQFGAKPEFRRTLVAALNPFKTYGIAVLPERLAHSSGSLNFSESTWYLLECLEKRKLTGNAAREKVFETMNELNAESAKLLGRIILTDLRGGFGESTVNKAIPKLIPEFVYMRCSLPAAAKVHLWPWSEGVISQLKADGMFANVNVENEGLIYITSRQGSPFPLEKLGGVVDSMRENLEPGYQHHGELLVEELKSDTGKWEVMQRATGNGRLNSVLKGGELPNNCRAIYQVWDRIPLSEVVVRGTYKVPYKKRIADLTEILISPDIKYITLIPTKIVYSLKEAIIHNREFVQAGLEGSVLKHPSAFWRDGDSLDQCKLKVEFSFELKVVGFNPGEGKNKSTFGSIACSSECGKLEVNISGFSDAERIDINGRREELLGAILCAKGNSIQYPSKIGGMHSIFLPGMVEWRSDKTTADTLERIIEQYDAVISGDSPDSIEAKLMSLATNKPKQKTGMRPN